MPSASICRNTRGFEGCPWSRPARRSHVLNLLVPGAATPGDGQGWPHHLRFREKRKLSAPSSQGSTTATHWQLQSFANHTVFKAIKKTDKSSQITPDYITGQAFTRAHERTRPTGRPHGHPAIDHVCNPMEFIISLMLLLLWIIRKKLDLTCELWNWLLPWNGQQPIF